MRVIAKRRDNTAIRLGINQSDSEWYEGKKVANFIKNLKNGDFVKITFDMLDNKKILKTIYKEKGNLPQQEPQAYNKPNPINNKDLTIRALAIGHMTSRTLIGLQSTLDANNILDTIDMLWDKFETRVSESESNL